MTAPPETATAQQTVAGTMGEIVRLIDLVAPFGHTEAMIADLKNVVPGIGVGG